MSIGAIAAGLKANLDTIDGINVSQIPRSNPVPPIIHMWPSEITYHRAMQMGMSQVTFTVQLIYAYSDDTTAFNVYDYLDAVGDRSVVAAIESDKTLGGAADTLQVDPTSGLALSVTATGEPRLTAEWTVTIYTGST